MTATALLADFHRSGIRLQARGDRLHVEAKPGTITYDLRRLLTKHKAELLAELAKPTAMRARLHSIAADAGLPASVVDAIDADELPLYDELSDGELLFCLWLRSGCPDCGGHHHNDGENTHGC